MMYIDPHIHVTSRTTDDYEAMQKAGIVAIIEPAFWLGQARTKVGSFQDYFSSLVGWERFRAKQFGIVHYCTIGLNSREANNVALAEEVMELLPLYVSKEGVVAIGEIGYDDQTEAEDRFYRLQLELAKEVDLPVMIHTPHRDKKKGTLRSMDVSEEHGLAPNMVIVDHNNEETVKDVLDRGYWAADWGISDPLAVPKTAALMREKGIPEEHIKMTCYGNALKAYGQSGQMDEKDWLEKEPIDQTKKMGGNTVLRGGQNPRVDSDSSNIIEN